ASHRMVRYEHGRCRARGVLAARAPAASRPREPTWRRPVSVPLQPVTFYVPRSSAEPIELSVRHSGLRMVLVNRESVRLLAEAEWKVLGVYFLLGPADDPEHFRAYVGEVGKRDLLTRLKEHAAQKEWWNRALLIVSASAGGFNSAEIGWLEGRL